jgi:hypothetical protein
LIDPVVSISFRSVALAAIAFWIPVMLSFRFAPGAIWAEYPGIVYHLLMYILVAKLPSPEWARAAGYGWLTLDIMTGVLVLNRVPRAIADPVRLGSHIFGGLWFIMVSLCGSLPIKIVGVLAGALLFGYTFVSPFLSTVWLSPASVLVLAWLWILAWRNGY